MPVREATSNHPVSLAEVNIALVGGGSGCKALIKFLEAHSLHHLRVQVVGVADPRQDAPGVVYAREKGIYTTRDYKSLFELDDLHLLIEITGKDDLLQDILKTKPRHLKVMDHLSARLFWELIELHDEKVRCERRLAHSDRLSTIGRMASYLAHEIRNPLVSIGGFAAAILNAPELPQNLKPKAEIIVNEVRRLEQVLKTLNDYIRPLEQNKTRGNFNRLVERAYIALEPDLRGSGVEMRIELDSEMPESLFDADLMLEALLSISRNLLGFMRPGQRFLVRTEVCWDSVGIYLETGGVWIPAATLENMFNPFTEHHTGGAGLDMAVSRKIIDDHGGDIKVADSLDQGTTVIIELPIEMTWKREELSTSA